MSNIALNSSCLSTLGSLGMSGGREGEGGREREGEGGRGREGGREGESECVCVCKSQNLDVHAYWHYIP